MSIIILILAGVRKWQVNIKINYIDDSKKRTTTTISNAIASFYCVNCTPNQKPTSADLVATTQKFVNDHAEHCTNKHAIETLMLFNAKQAIIDKHSKQQRLF